MKTSRRRRIIGPTRPMAPVRRSDQRTRQTDRRRQAAALCFSRRRPRRFDAAPPARCTACRARCGDMETSRPHQRRGRHHTAVAMTGTDTTTTATTQRPAPLEHARARE